jgi:amino acid transporter
MDQARTTPRATMLALFAALALAILTLVVVMGLPGLGSNSAGNGWHRGGDVVSAGNGWHSTGVDGNGWH